MALVTSTTWAARTGRTVTGADLAALDGWCAGVDAAVKRVIAPFLPEPVTISNLVLDAPVDDKLDLPAVPVRSITSLWYNPDADGDPSAFTADNLLTQYTDYWLPVDDPMNNWSRSGRVLRRSQASWGVEWRRPFDRLARRTDPNRGALKVTFAAGPLTPPEDIVSAACLAVSMLFERRKTGVALASESLTGYSYSAAGPFTAVGAVQSPDVMSLLSKYMTVHVGGP